MTHQQYGKYSIIVLFLLFFASNKAIPEADQLLSSFSAFGRC